MAKRRPSGKRTKEEIARSIRQEGVMDIYKSGTRCEYWYAFGQHWRLTFTSYGASLVSIEQVDENYEPISFKNTDGTL